MATITTLAFWNVLRDPVRTIQEDVAFYWQGQHSAVNEQIRQGAFPHWNPYGLAGQRLFADINVGLFYPGSILFRLLPFPKACLWTWVAHYIALAVATYGLARVGLKVSPAAAVLAGIVFALGGFCLGHCNHLNFVFALPWMSLLLLATYQVHVFGSRRAMIWWLVGLVCLVNLVLSGGAPILILALVALAWLSGWLILGSLLRKNYYRAIRVTMCILTMGLCALGVTAFQLFPTIDLYSSSVRSAWEQEELLAGTIAWRTLLCQIMAPGVLGNLRSGAWGDVGHERFVFVGGVGLTFAVMGVAAIRRHPWVAALLILLIVSTVLAVGNTPVLRAVNTALFVFKIRQPSRYVGLFQLAVALLAAVGLHQWLVHDRKAVSRKTEAVCIGTFAAMSAVTLGMLCWIGEAGSSPEAFAQWIATRSNSVQQWVRCSTLSTPLAVAHCSAHRGALLTCSMVVWCSGGLLVWGCTWLRTVLPRLSLCLIGSWCTLELLLFGAGTWAGLGRFPGVIERPTPLVDFLQHNLGDDRYFNAATYLPLWENRGAVHHLANADGYVGSLNVSREHDALFRELHGSLTMLNLFSTKYVLLRENREPGPLTPVFHSDGIVVYENPHRLRRATLLAGIHPVPDIKAALELMKLPTFNPQTTGILIGQESGNDSCSQPLDDTESCSIVQWDAGQIQIEAQCDTPRWLLVGTSYDKGWRAWLDDKTIPLQRANVCFIGAQIPPGHHVVRLDYRTPKLSAGMAISVTALAVLFVGMLLCLYDHRLQVLGPLRSLPYSTTKPGSGESRLDEYEKPHG